jgi:hypothetical protein
LRTAQAPNPENAAGMDAGLNKSLGFLRSKNPQLKNGMDAILEQRKG